VGKSKNWAVDLFRKLFLMMAMPAAVLAGCGTSDTDRRVGTDMVDVPYSADGDDENVKHPEMTFDVYEFNTGRILQGDVRQFEFNFTNTGKAPLIISGVSASCGCTVPRNYPKQKIMPGEGGTIEVEYDSDNKWGEQVSVVAITANTLPNRTELIIRAEVVAPNRP